MLERTTRRKRRTTAPPRTGRAILYGRVSLREMAEDGGGLIAQHQVLERIAQERGWTDPLWIQDPGVSGATMDRPGMQRALEMLTSGTASILAATKLDRLSRSVIDAANLMELADERGFALVIPDLGVDTSTASGRMVTHLLAAVAEWERDTISERTRAGMAAIKATTGKHMGRPAILDLGTANRIRTMREAGGLTYRQMAQRLDADGIKSATGARWTAASIRSAIRRITQSETTYLSETTGR
jgi:DNA invertase Pin-like site-specific DNA recombinase